MSNARIEKKRDSAIELCRIIAMLAIVAHHFAIHGGFSYSQEITIPHLWYNLIMLGGKFGVDVFVLISGFFLILDRKQTINVRKLLKFWGEVELCSVLFFLVGVCLNKTEFSIKLTIRTLFPITFSSWWFASAYFVMILLHPFLNLFLHRITKKQYRLFLLVLVVIWVVIPTFTTSAFQSNELLEFMLLYSIGGYIQLYGLRQNVSWKTDFILWLIFAGITYVSSIVLLMLGKKIPLFKGREFYFYGYNRLLTVLRSICFFVAFTKITISYNKIINIIASATFGVYLIHDSEVIRPILWEEVFRNASYQETLIIIPYSLLVVTIVFLGCVSLDLLRQKTIEKLYMKFIDRHYTQIENRIQKCKKKIGQIVFGKE